MTVLDLSRGARYPGDAACREHPGLMWPADGETDSGRRRRETAALAVCAACPVFEQCAVEAPQFMHGTGGVMAGQVWRPHRDRTGRKYGKKSTSKRPAWIECQDCGARREVAPAGGVPRFCRDCTALRHAESQRRHQVAQAQSPAEPCPICGLRYAGPLGVAGHLALTHGIRGMSTYGKAG